jgi:hypothetical protein
MIETIPKLDSAGSTPVTRFEPTGVCSSPGVRPRKHYDHTVTSSWTVGQVTDRVVELGLIDAQTPAQKLDPDVFHKTLDYFGTPDHRAVLRLLDELGSASRERGGVTLMKT